MEELGVRRQGFGVRDSGFAARIRGNSNMKSSPEEKAMKDTYNLSEFGSFTRARQILGGVTMLLALTLAGVPRLWGQALCNGAATVTSVSVSPGSVVGGSGTILTATINVTSAVPPDVFYVRLVGVGISGVAGGITSPLYYGQAVFPCDKNTETLQFQVGAVSQRTTGTFFAYTATEKSAEFEVLPAGQQPENPPNLGPCNDCQQQAGSPINLTNGNV